MISAYWGWLLRVALMTSMNYFRALILNEPIAKRKLVLMFDVFLARTNRFGNDRNDAFEIRPSL